MNNTSKISSQKMYLSPANFKKQQKLVDQYLTRITILQSQLEEEHEKLMQLLRIYKSYNLITS